MKKNTLYLLAGTVVIGSALLVASYKLGQQSGSEALSRIQLVWPAFDSMNAQDKAIISGYSITCELEDVALEKPAVLACLQAASVDPAPLLPKGLNADQARARLEQLIPAD